MEKSAKKERNIFLRERQMEKYKCLESKGENLHILYANAIDRANKHICSFSIINEFMAVRRFGNKFVLLIHIVD